MQQEVLKPLQPLVIPLVFIAEFSTCAEKNRENKKRKRVEDFEWNYLKHCYFTKLNLKKQTNKWGHKKENSELLDAPTTS